MNTCIHQVLYNISTSFEEGYVLIHIVHMTLGLARSEQNICYIIEIQHKSNNGLNSTYTAGTCYHMLIYLRRSIYISKLVENVMHFAVARIPQS